MSIAEYKLRAILLLDSFSRTVVFEFTLDPLSKPQALGHAGSVGHELHLWKSLSV